MAPGWPNVSALRSQSERLSPEQRKLETGNWNPGESGPHSFSAPSQITQLFSGRTACLARFGPSAPICASLGPASTPIGCGKVAPETLLAWCANLMAYGLGTVGWARWTFRKQGPKRKTGPIPSAPSAPDLPGLSVPLTLGKRRSCHWRLFVATMQWPSWGEHPPFMSAVYSLALVSRLSAAAGRGAGLGESNARRAVGPVTRPATFSGTTGAVTYLGGWSMEIREYHEIDGLRRRTEETTEKPGEPHV